MEELGLPERLFQTGEEPFGRHWVNTYFTLRWIENMKPALTDDQLEILARSQFGHLMQMGDHTFSVMFVHHLLSRQLVTKKEFELWWVYAGKPIRYGIEDFAVVTGLLCGEDYGGLPPVSANTKIKGKGKQKDVGGEGKIWKSLFGNKERITPDWIHERLLLGKEYKDDDTRFRLALILLVEGILCPTSAVTLVRPEVVEMAGDVERFIKYPWGRESFLMTVKSAKTQTAGKYVQESVAMQGFVHAIVLVTVCCCPQIIAHGDEDLILAEDITIEDLVQAVCGRSLIVNPQTARNLDKKGQAAVRSILHDVDDGSRLGFREEVEDPKVDHMLQLIAERFPFEPNSWRGGVKAAETKVLKRRTVPRKEAYSPTDPGMTVDNGGEKHSDPIPEPEEVTDEGDARQCVSIKELLRMAGNEYEERAVSMFAGYASSVKDHFDAVVGEMRAQFTSQLERMERKLSKKDAGSCSCSAEGDDNIRAPTGTGPLNEVIHGTSKYQPVDVRDAADIVIENVITDVGRGADVDKSTGPTPREVEGRTGASASEIPGGDLPTQECEGSSANVHVADEAGEQAQENVQEEGVERTRVGLAAEGGAMCGGISAAVKETVEQEGVSRSSGSVAGGDNVDGGETVAEAVGVREGPVQDPGKLSESVEKQI